MKILALTDFYPPHVFGGYELQCKLQVQELGVQGHDLLVLTSHRLAECCLPEKGVLRYLHFIHPYNDALKTGGGKHDLVRLARRLSQAEWFVRTRHNRALARQVIVRFSPDVVCAWHLSGVGLGPVLAAQECGIPVVFNVYDYWLADLKAALVLEPKYLKRKFRAVVEGLSSFDDLNLQHLLVCSQAVQEHYIMHGFSSHPITITPNGLPASMIVSPDDLPPVFKLGSDNLKLVYVGRVVPAKGVHVAIEAIAHLVKEEPGAIFLDIIGGGLDGYTAELRIMVETLGLQDRVRFIGMLPQHELFLRLASYDALLFPSCWVEPFGMIVLEAMARGLPVIASSYGGPAEIITNGEDGLLVPPDDSAALADAVRRLAANPGLANTIQRHALETVRNRYTIRRVVNRLEQYLQWVVS